MGETTSKQRGNLIALDGRSRQAHRLRKLAGSVQDGQRLREIVGWIASEMDTGDLSPLAMAKIERCATLLLIAEKTRARALGETADLNALIRVENTAARALQALGISTRKRGSQSLLERLSAKPDGKRVA